MKQRRSRNALEILRWRVDEAKPNFHVAKEVPVRATGKNGGGNAASATVQPLYVTRGLLLVPKDQKNLERNSAWEAVQVALFFFSRRGCSSYLCVERDPASTTARGRLTLASFRSLGPPLPTFLPEVPSLHPT
ncbi:hypothetical protein TNCV_3590151 [Trichonephila clavipes]|nr:hypothetical protein TNCV_3590151 [Trichonephila clavipes]